METGKADKKKIDAVKREEILKQEKQKQKAAETNKIIKKSDGLKLNYDEKESGQTT
jgi:hypothetical protein